MLINANLCVNLGALAEQVVKDLPKHLNRLSETVVLFGQEVVNRAWDLKAEAERVIADLSKDKKTAPKAKSKIKKNFLIKSYL